MVTMGQQLQVGPLRVWADDSRSVIGSIVERAESATSSALMIQSVNAHHCYLVDRGLDPGWAVRAVDLCDGWPVPYLIERLLGETVPLLPGSDLTLRLLEEGNSRGWRIAVIGGTEEMHRALREVVSTRYPNVLLGPLLAPSRSDLTDEVVMRQIAQSIKLASPNVLLVALGKPRQEAWMAEWGEATDVPVICCFGASLDFIAGAQKRAPAVVRQIGMEWAWRLALNPRRLLRRYLWESPVGLFRLAWWALSARRARSTEAA